jgi:predicted MPP superfamily phosphohydrolase
MRDMRTRHLSVITAFFLMGCSLFEYHPYEIRLDESHRDINQKAIEEILNLQRKDTTRFIFIGDTQRFYDETEDFVEQANNEDADFVVLAGDITDFGLENEFIWVHDILSGLNKPYVAIVGNHDLLGKGEAIFNKMYGTDNFYFDVNSFRFIGINTNSREYAFSGNVPDTAWLKQSLHAPDDIKQAFVMAHVAPFNPDFDPRLEAAYARILRESGKVNLSLYAHQHSFSSQERYNDGIQYVVAAAMDSKFYLLVKVWRPNGFEITRVNY